MTVRGRGAPGFTLIALLVGITVLGLIAVMVTAGLQLGVRGTQAIDSHADRLDGLRTAQSFIRTHLGAARPRLGTGRERAAAFAGGPRELSFAAAVSPRRGGGVRWIHLFVAERDGARALVASRRLAPVRARSPGEAPSEAITLVPGIEEARFAYFGSSPAEAPPRWHERWAGEPDLPRLVRLEIRLAGADARAWPTLVVAPMIDRVLR